MYYIPSHYDDFYYPSDRYDLLRRQRAHEQARRAAAEKQRREDMLRRRMMYEQELERREREENYRRRALEQERVRQAELLRRQRAMRMEPRRDAQEEYVTVRGPGGYLYRVHRNDLEGTEHPTRDENQTRRPSVVMDEDAVFPEMVHEVETPHGTVHEEQARRGKSNTTKHPKRKKKITFIVEDASDSETECDEMQSVWRNRRPGPGESWMEPVSNAL